MSYRRRGALSPGLALGLLLACCAGAKAQQTATESDEHTKAQVTFQFERKGLPVPKFTFTVSEDGSGTYDAEDASQGTANPVHREFTLTPAMTGKIFELTRGVHLTTAICASKAKNIADTGTKTLTYVADGSTNACTYNYTENKDVAGLTDIFQGVAETLDEGRKLDFLHRFDRLGLDDAIAVLADEVSRGQALEIEIIAPSLRSIADDAEVIQRVRTKARMLLAAVSGRNQAQ